MSTANDLKPIAISFSEAARLVGFSEKTLRRAARDGRLTVARAGRAARILFTDLEQWLDDRRQGGLADFERRHDRKSAGRAAFEGGA
jgi:excisionase family DNA binding protein